MSNRERLEALRKRKRLQELRAKRDAAAPSEPSLRDRLGDAGRGLTSGFEQGASLGFADEAKARVRSWLPSYGGMERGDYEGNLAKLRGEYDANREAAPIASAAGELTGALAGAGKFGAGLQGARGAAAAGGVGAAYGAGTAEGGLRDRAESAAVGGLLGAVGQRGFEMAGDGIAALSRTRAAERAKEAAMPTLDAMRQTASDLYSKVDDLGVRYSPGQIQALFQGIKDQVPTEGLGAITSGTHPTANAVVRQMERVGPRDTSLLEVDRLRQFTGGASPTNPADGRMAGLIRDEIDHFTAGVTPAQGGREATEILGQARDAHGQFRRAQQVDEALGAAELGAESNRVPDVLFSQRKAIKNILNSPKKRRGYSPEQIEAMEGFVRMTPTQKFTDFMAKNGRGQMGVALGGGAGFAMGGPVGALAVPALGYAARKVGDRSSEKARDAMVRALRTQGMPDAIDTRAARIAEDQRIQGLLNRLAIVAAN